MEIVSHVTGKRIFAWVTKTGADGEAIEIVYPSQLTKEEASKFSVRGQRLQVIKHKADAEIDGAVRQTRELLCLTTYAPRFSSDCESLLNARHHWWT